MISVVICTYNRSRLLAQALASLAAQDLDKACFEVLVIDNNSNDGTAEVSRRAVGSVSLRYFLEERQGLSHARNRGWREAHGEYVAYLDDDCTVPVNYLSVAREVIQKVGPAMFGGPVRPWYEQGKPEWYKDEYVAYELTDTARALGREEFVYGGNMILRRPILDRLGGFDAEFGMAGATIGYGEEILPQQALRERMPDEVIHYDPRLYVNHLTRPEKMTLRWGFREAFVRGVYLDRVFHSDEPVAPRAQLRRRMIRKSLDTGTDLLRGLFLRDRARYPRFQNYVFENTFAHATELGRLREKHRRSLH